MKINLELPIFVLLAASLGLTSAIFGVSRAVEETKRTDIVTMGGKPLTLVGYPIKVGEKAPDFTAIDKDMKPVSLSDYDGKVRIVTAFPSIDTEVCSIQARRFNQEASKLDNIQILTVSADLPFALNRFCAAEGIDKVRTLSDHRLMDFGHKYGFLIDELRLLARGTVIIDKDGVVRYVEYVPELGEEPDYEKAVNVAAELDGQA